MDEQNTNKNSDRFEEFKVEGRQLVDKFKELLREGNIRRIVVKNEKGDTIVEMPVTIGAIGAVLAPWVAAIGAVAALASNFTIEVEKDS